MDPTTCIQSLIDSLIPQPINLPSRRHIQTHSHCYPGDEPASSGRLHRHPTTGWHILLLA
jgi:hypothetical protein